MINLLPTEIQEFILNDIPFATCRVLNKYYLELADKIKIQKNEPIIINEHILISYLDSVPDKIKFKIVTENVIKRFKFKNSFMNSGEFELYCCVIRTYDHNQESVTINHTSYDRNEIKYIFKYMNHNEFFPDHDIIMFAGENHPLKRNWRDWDFMFKMLVSTTKYYKNKLRSTNYDTLIYQF